MPFIELTDDEEAQLRKQADGVETVRFGRPVRIVRVLPVNTSGMVLSSTVRYVAEEGTIVVVVGSPNGLVYSPVALADDSVWGADEPG